MRRREALAALIAGALIMLALIAVFAVDLVNNQARSRNDIKSQAHQNAVLVARLIDSVFAAVSVPNPQLVAEYGAAKVSDRTLNGNRGSNEYVALLTPDGRVLAASRGFNAQARSDIQGPSSVLQMVAHGKSWALGNRRPYGATGAIDLAVRLPTRNGTRILLTGFDPALLSAFTARELQQVPGGKGAHHYLLDGNGVVIASTNPARPPGYVFHTPAQIDVLTRSSGTVNGHYFDQVPLANSTWKVLLAAPDGAFFASVSGTRHWLPWVIFAAFSIVALLALLLAGRALRNSELVVEANAKLAASNAELERRARELSRSNAELEQFASIASHDLQEPLRKVRTFTGRVRETEAETISERGLDYLRRADASAERMQRLIEDLLVFSRVAMQTRAFGPVDLGEVAREVLEDLDDLVRRSGAVVHVGPLPTVIADGPQMRQLVQNLLSNALKFRRADVTPEVRIEATVQSGEMRLTVSDNGIGFDPQYSRRIFRVFERLNGRGAYPGTGIGLALCRKIVERHGGTMRAESSPGQGAMFTVTMPVDNGTPSSTAGTDSPGQEEDRYAAV